MSKRSFQSNRIIIISLGVPIGIHRMFNCLTDMMIKDNLVNPH